MTTELMMLEVRNRQQWRTWLGKHHASCPGVWLAYYKGHTGVKSIPYEDSVREALCFGWIDSLIKRVDDDRYSRKFTPRRPASKWSGINRKRWAELNAAGLLTAAGLAAEAHSRVDRFAGGRKEAGLEVRRRPWPITLLALCRRAPRGRDRK
jgi:uncharacterized protein YdeI (YjbR/CyaY-like superfamily)